MEDVFYKSTGKGMPVVLIHGFCETHEIWNGIVEPLSKEHQIVAIDLPGFGKSNLPIQPFTIDAIATIVSDFLIGIGVHQPIVIGHSLGGYVTLAMAAQEPESYRAIGLFHSTAYADTDEKKANRDKTIEFVRRNGVPPFIETYVQRLFSQKQHPAIQDVKRIGLQTSSDTLVAYSLAMRNRPSRVDFLKSFHKPVLFLGGEDDTIVPLASMEEQSHFAPKASFYALAEAGHMGMFERREDSLIFVEDFLAKIPE